MTSVTIDFATSHLIFPTLVGVILVLLTGATAITHWRSIAGSAAYRADILPGMERLRLPGTIALTVVYFSAMVPVAITALVWWLFTEPFFLTLAQAGPMDLSQIGTPLFLFLFLTVGGTFVGIVFGAIPGMTATMAIAVRLPLTYSLGLENGLALLLGLYAGGISGGLVPAILLGIPGTPSSITNTFDGYPMSLKGGGERALRIGIVAFFVGGASSVLQSCISSRSCRPILRSASAMSRSS